MCFLTSYFTKTVCALCRPPFADPCNIQHSRRKSAVFAAVGSCCICSHCICSNVYITSCCICSNMYITSGNMYITSNRQPEQQSLTVPMAPSDHLSTLSPNSTTLERSRRHPRWWPKHCRSWCGAGGPWALTCPTCEGRCLGTSREQWCPCGPWAFVSQSDSIASRARF